MGSDSDYRLAQAMQTRATSFGLMIPVANLFVEPRQLDPDTLAADGYALEVWYAHHGWFDARVDGWELREARRRTRSLARVVDLVGHVTPGPRSVVRQLDIAFGARDASGVFRPFEDPKQQALYRAKRNAVLRASGLRVGDGFDLELAEGARAALVESLRRSSRAYADAALQVVADPEAQAVSVRVEATPGVSSKFGAVTVDGNRQVPTDVILDQAGISGTYDISRLRDAQQRLFDLQMFSLATVTPDLSDPTRSKVPVKIQVTEAKPRTLRAGGGFDYTGLVLTPRARVSFEDRRLPGLLRLSTSGELGYAYTIGRVGGGTPVGSASVGLSQARLFGNRKLAGSIKASVEQDVQNGQFSYFNPQADLDVTYRASKAMAFTFGPHFEQYRYLDLDRAGLVARSTFGEGFENPYTLATFDVAGTYDSRDNAWSATSGWYNQLHLRQAVPVGAGGFLYSELRIESRKYLRVRRRLYASLRAMGDVIQSWGGRPLPYPERVFLGGANDLRGFWDGQVGGYDCLCLYRAGRSGDPFTGIPGKGQELQKFYAPKGGALGGVAAGELRWDVDASTAVVAFGNVGVLGDQWADVVDPKRYRVGYGVGGRYNTAVGPIRLDLAFRPLYDEDVAPDSYVNCLATDQSPRSFDLGSLPVGSRDLSRRVVPFAVTVYLAIGQAI